MKLTAYALFPETLPLRAAPPSRDWMDRIPERHAYRCLPLAIANAHGWEVTCVCDFEAAWDGGPHARNVQLRALDGFPNLAQYVVTHFAFGIITFHLTYLFRTEPGWNLVATGPTNLPKDGIAPLTGVIETDWLPYPFTMNWQMTRPGRVRSRRASRSASCTRCRQARLRTRHPRFAISRTIRSSWRRRSHGRIPAMSSCSASMQATSRRARPGGSATASWAGGPMARRRMRST